jgi:hypothetical protein
VLDGGVKLTTLRDAIAHLGKAVSKSDHDMPEVLTAAEMLTSPAEYRGPVEFARIGTLQALNRQPVRVFNSDSQRRTLGAPQTEARHSMKLTHRFAQLTPEKRPQDPNLDGTGLRFETMDHGGEYPDTMPQAIKLVDAEGRSCIYVPITQDDKVVDSQGYTLDREED